MGISLSRIYTFLHEWWLMQNEVVLETDHPMSFSSRDVTKMQRSISLAAREETKVEMLEESDDFSSKKMTRLQVSISFKMNGAEAETTSTTVSITPQYDASENVEMHSMHVPVIESGSGNMKLRKSFRTRHRRSGSVVVIDPQWWMLLESTELERCSMASTSSSETPKSKWCRAKVKAVRVGKGLSKNRVFRKLSSQHWLEAVDSKHRYGHNLRHYHVLWLKSTSKEHFFHWLSHGEGKDLNLDEICPRFKLHQQRVKYLSPVEREAYEVLFEDGKFKNKKTNKLINTSGDGKWIFVLSTSGKLYVGQKKKGLFHHSSFLAGGAISAAGRVLVENGALKAISRQSGHYRPTEENFKYFISFLKDNNVDLTDVDVTYMDEEAEAHPKKNRRRNLSQEDLTHIVEEDHEVKILTRPLSKSFRIRSFRRRLSFVLISAKHHPFRSLSAHI